MTTRISDSNVFADALRFGRIARSDLSRLQNQAASGKRIFSVSDDPVGASRVIGLKSSLEQIEQFKRNISSAQTRLESSEAAISDLTDVLIRVRELAVSADIEQPQFDLLREEVEQRFAQILAISNTRFADGFLFSGFATSTAPVTQTGVFTDPAPIVAYGGDSGQILVQSDESSRVQVNVTARELFFGSTDNDDIADGPNVNIFSVVQDLINRLDDPATNGQPVETLDELDAALDQVNRIVGRLGARSNRLETDASKIDSLRVVVERERSLLEDADLIEVITELQSRESTFQATLSVTARIIQPTLLDFLG
jgi:flagellar hook-associated protein 3 FlgL